MNRVDDLWEHIVSAENCDASIDDVNASHHWHNHHTPNRCTAWVETTKPDRVKDMQRTLNEGFVQAPFKTKRRYDPSAQKWRDTNEPKQWPDQYIHHALIRGIMPVLMRGMDKYCCGSIKKRGTDYGRDAIERWMQDDPKGTKYCLQCDIYHFYPSLQPEVVMARMRELIRRARWTMRRGIRGEAALQRTRSAHGGQSTAAARDRLRSSSGGASMRAMRRIMRCRIFRCRHRKRILLFIKLKRRECTHMHSLLFTFHPKKLQKFCYAI